MRKKGSKGRCEKRVVGKYEGVCRIYDPIQSAWGLFLEITADRIVILPAVSIIAFCGFQLQCRFHAPEQLIQYGWKTVFSPESSKYAALRV